MNNVTLTVCLTASILAGVVTESHAAGEHDGIRGPQHSFEELDANSDGLIAADEMQAHREARFALADTDGDGALTREEMETRMEGEQTKRRAKFIDRMFKKRDANGDGMLTMAEMADGRADRMFSKADANGDGFVSKAEFDSARESHGGHKKQ
jgi:Ca2+-binding EF-hand superfamily protein